MFNEMREVTIQFLIVQDNWLLTYKLCVAVCHRSEQWLGVPIFTAIH